MKRFPHLLLAFALALAPLSARAGECDDDFSECKEDCLIQYGGSIRVEVKKKYEKCLKKCSKTARRCTERQMETKSNNLDEGALDGAPTSDQVDADGLPTRDAASKKAPKKEAPVDHDDDLRHDAPAHQGEELPADEVPKSSRSTLKTDEKSGPPPEATKKREAPKAEPVAEKRAEPADEPAPIRMTPKKDDGKSAGDDLRDDGPRDEKPADEEAPRPKRREKPKEPPPKKEEDHDDLRFY